MDGTKIIEVFLCKSYFNKKYLAQNQNTPTEIFYLLSNSEDPLLRYCVAENLSTPRTILKAMASSQDVNLVKILMNNPNSTFEMFEIMSNSHAMIQSAVAENPNTPIEILEKLSSNKNIFVVCEVMDNIKTTNEIFNSILHNNTDSYVIYKMAICPNTPVYILEKLIKDHNGIIGKYAYDNIKQRKQFVQMENTHMI